MTTLNALSPPFFSPLVADAVTCGQTTMAVRMPSHPVARALIEAAGVPLAAPSANSSGRPSPTSAAHVMADLAAKSGSGREAAEPPVDPIPDSTNPPSPAPGRDSVPAASEPRSQASSSAASGGGVFMVIDGGPCVCGIESTVLDGLRVPPAVLRPGGVTFEQLRALEGLEGLQV